MYEKTRHGGWRRTGTAQIVGNAQEASSEAGAYAWADVKGVREGAKYLEGHRSDKAKVSGSNPFPRTKLIIQFNEALGLPECPYVVRWRIETPWGSIRLHHWLSHDDDRAMHDHPWDFLTFVLRGGYTDVSLDGDQYLKAPTMAYRKSTHQHTVFPDEKGAWTLVITGPKIRKWGFWINGKFVKMNKYFLTYGHHPCD